MSFDENDYNTNYYSRSCPVCDSPSLLPKVHIRISSNKYSSSSSHNKETYDSLSLTDRINNYNTNSNIHNDDLNYDKKSILINKVI